MPTASSRWQAQLLGYQSMPVEQLLCAEEVELADPIASLIGQPGCRELCANCGEEVVNQREILTPHGLLCRARATGRYYRALPHGDVWTSDELALVRGR